MIQEFRITYRPGGISSLQYKYFKAMLRQILSQTERALDGDSALWREQIRKK